MPPRRTGQTSSHESSPNGKKGKEKGVEGSAEASHSGSDESHSGGKSQSTLWTLSDERYLLDFIHSYNARMGKESSFTPELWSEMASQFPTPSQGKKKTAATCKGKWNRMKKKFDIVDKIANTSGFAYSLEKGADIRTENAHVWEDIAKTIRGASKFKTKGWIHYEQMLPLVKSKGNGKNKIAALQIAQDNMKRTAKTVRGPLDTAESAAGTSTSHPTASTSNSVYSSSVPLPSTPPSTSFVHASDVSGFRPASTPSSFVGTSSMTSINPSSSVSQVARLKRRADDDDSSMVSAGKSATSTKSSASARKRRASSAVQANDEALNALSGRIGTLIGSFEHNTNAIEHFTSSRTTSQLATDTRAERRNNARTLLLQRDLGFLSPEEVAETIHLFQNDDSVDVYLLLATSDASNDEVRRAWLKLQLSHTVRPL